MIPEDLQRWETKVDFFFLFDVIILTASQCLPCTDNYHLAHKQYGNYWLQINK